MILATGAAPGAGGGGLSLLLLALPILLLIYLMFNQRRRAKALGDAQRALQVGQEVLTTAGVYGVITGIEPNVIHLQIAEGVIVRHDRRAIVPLSMASSQQGGQRPGDVAPGEGPEGGEQPR